MSCRLWCWCATALVALVVTPWNDSIAASRVAKGAAPPAECASGAPARATCAPPAVPVVPAGLDDLLQPLREEAPPAWLPPVLSDLAAAPPPPAPEVALWRRLEAIPPARRECATITIELGDAAGPEAAALSAAAAARWNAGEHDAAIAALQAFEEAGGDFAVGVSWKPGAGPAAVDGGTDVRIGGTRTSARSTNLDFHEATGNLFCVVRWGSTTGTADWTVNLSEDGGTTWRETYDYWSSLGIVDVSAAVVGDLVYIGYVVGSASNSMRVRRCSAITGASDESYGFHVALSAGTRAFTEVTVVTNAEDFDNRVYCFAVQSDSTLRLAWDSSTDGTTFTDVTTPAITGVVQGLDATWVNGFGSGRFLFVSFAGANGYVHVCGYMDGNWSNSSVASASGVVRPTSISVRGSTVICAYEYLATEGRAIHYSISYDSGETWNIGVLATPDGTVSAFQAPSVDARDANGTAMVYTAEIGAMDLAYYRVRRGYAPGTWEEPVAFNDLDVVTGTETELAHLPRFGPAYHSHGAIYMNGSPVPYFDHPGPGELDAPASIPVPGRPTLRLAGANPVRGIARLDLAVPRAGYVDVCVYDVGGALVRRLAAGDMGAGHHPLAWTATRSDDTTAGPGVYFVKVRSALGDAALRLVLLE